MAKLWRVLPSGIPRTPRKIKGGPLIDLAALQQAIRHGVIGAEHVLVVNRSCDNNLEDLEWGTGDVLDCLLCATSADFKGAEWCETNLVGLIPCDAYVIPYDETIKQRSRAGLAFYVKFSLDDADTLKLQLVRVHL